MQRSPATRAWVVTLLMAVMTAAGSSSCRRAATVFDCQAVCSRYRECIDSKYDVGGCRQRCQQRAITDRAAERKADTCESCIKGHSCLGATFECGGQCLGVVP